MSSDGDSTTSLGNQCLVTPIMQNCFQIFRRNLLCFSLCLLPPVLPLGTIQSLALSSLSSPFRLFLHISNSFPELSLLQAEQSQLSWPLFTGNKLQCISLPSAAQDAVACLCCKGTLLAHGHLLVHQDPKLPLSQAAFYLLSPRLTNKTCKCLKMNSTLKCVSAKHQTWM